MQIKKMKIAGYIGVYKIKNRTLQNTRMEVRPRTCDEDKKKRPERICAQFICVQLSRRIIFQIFIANIIFTWSVSMRIC